MRLLLKPIMEQLQLQIPIQPDWSEFRQATLSKTLSNVSSGSCSSVTTTAMEEEVCRWDDELDGLPVFDWETFIGGDDFAGLFESMLGETGETMPEMSLSLSNSSQPGSWTSEESGSVSMEIEPPNDDDSKGLRLVHLLMAAAEAITGPNKSRDLACVILVRLKELVSRTKGSNMERLAAYFTEGLRCLIEGNSVPKNHHHPPWPNHREDHQHGDVLAAFQLLQDMSPYVKFGHFTANQAILEAVACERRVHIVDYDIMEGIQWASLMQALVSKKDGPPPPHLRITALTRGQNGRKSISSVQETGRRLLAFAASIGQPFSFHQCRLDSDEHFRPSALKLVKGEALVVNCMLHIPHLTYRTPDSVASFLEGVKSLNPRVVTLVEEEVEPYGEGFVGRFMDSLHHYSALYDSMEAGFPMQGRARALVEQVFLGPRIAASLAYMYRWHGRVNKGWSEWMDGSGFKPIQITFFNHCQAKLLLGLFNDGYKVEESANRLVLGWKSRSLLSASVWSAPLEP